MTLVALSTLLMVCWSTLAQGREPSFKERAAVAAAVVAVEILSADYSKTPADGPMVATARLLKVLKGPLVVGQPFQFSETAWVGPNYRKGEYRILFLERASEARPGGTEVPPSNPTPWRTVVRLTAREDF